MHQQRLSMRWQRWTRCWMVLLVVSGISTACTTNPVTGKRELSFVSEQQERAIGQKNYGPYRQAQGGDYVVDPALTRYVQRVAQRLVQVSDRRLDYEFQVINDSTPNAWALPGGKIALHRGLLLALKNEAELAAVLAHEIIHAAARHSAQGMQRDMLLQGAVLAAGVVLADSKHQDVGMLGANLGAKLTGLHFGRDAEREADAYGIRYMVRAGYDPQAAVTLQQTFVQLKNNKQPGWLEGMFASHPPSQERVRNNQRLVQTLGNPGGELGAAAYQRATAHLRRTQPAYRLYDQAAQALAKKDPNKALTLVNQALAIEPREALFHGLRGEIRQAQGQNRAALADLDQAIRLYPDFFRFRLARGLVHQKNQQFAAAKRDLAASAQLLPTPKAYFGLGELAQTTGEQQLAIQHFRQVAASNSALAKPAGIRLARLDLAAHPERFLAARLAVGPNQRLVLQVKNNSLVAVHQIRLVLRDKNRVGSIQPQTTFRLGQALAPGAEAAIKTRVPVPDRATLRRYVVQVDQAQVLQ